MPSSGQASIDTFQPDKRTLGLILSSTSPPIRVPDYQRDYSWEKQQVEEFWTDLTEFGGNPPASLVGKEYFLGAAVLVNNGTYHLLLDGQQRLATATILLAALRDKIGEFSRDAANQIQANYITFEDHLTGERVFKVQMNLFDRNFFRDFIQVSPRISETRPSKKSHFLIKNAYEFFALKISEGWSAAGSNKRGFEWAAHIAQILREHMVLVTVISNNEKSANLIFATLNDRGIGLSTVDLIRSLVLQQAPDSHRQEIIECWDAMFNSCGKDLAAETLIRMSWVAQHGDVKSRSLYKIVSEALDDDITSLGYRQFRDADADDGEVQENLIALRTLKFNACYPLLFSAERQLTPEENKNLINALVALVIRHNIVCGLDRAKIESTVYATAKMLSDGGDYGLALRALQNISPSTTQFSGSFEKLAFSKSDHSIARYLLTCFDSQLATTQEVTVAGANRVHIEHIYPQTPLPQNCWENHDQYVRLIGNMTLLDKRLNESIKNADFVTKKASAYVDSRLEVTKALLQYDSWSPQQIAERQAMFCELAQTIWPATLI
jgi:hypothetical protein